MGVVCRILTCFIKLGWYLKIFLNVAHWSELLLFCCQVWSAGPLCWDTENDHVFISGELLIRRCGARTHITELRLLFWHFFQGSTSVFCIWLTFPWYVSVNMWILRYFIHSSIISLPEVKAHRQLGCWSWIQRALVYLVVYCVLMCSMLGLMQVSIRIYMQPWFLSKCCVQHKYNKCNYLL